MSRHSAGLSRLLVACVSSFACSGHETLPPSDSCEQTCTGDACERDIECSVNADCPRGTVCDDTTCSVAPYAEPASSALVKGFNVREFDLARPSEGLSTGYAFRAPSDSRFVVCGLFACEPSFEPLTGDDDGTRIQNVSRCLVRRRVFRIEDAHEERGRDFSFQLTDLRRLEREHCSQKSAVLGLPDDPDYPVVTSLNVGCWALDDTSVVAATALHRLSLSEFPEYGDLPVECSNTSAPTEGSICYEKQSGSCRSGSCEIGVAPHDPTETQMAASRCTTADEGRACVDDSTRLGRCLNGGCVNADVPQLERPLVVSNCAGAATDWLNCFPSPHGVFGTCRDGLCRARCRVPEDCPAPPQGVPMSTRECEPNGQYVGLCVEGP